MQNLCWDEEGFYKVLMRPPREGMKIIMRRLRIKDVGMRGEIEASFQNHK